MAAIRVIPVCPAPSVSSARRAGRRFLMMVTSSYKRFTWRRIPSIYLSRLFREWSLCIARSYSISFKLLELMELDWMNYGWVDPLSRVCRQPHWCSTNGVDMILCCVWLRFENSSPRWRIVGRERRNKKRWMEFFSKEKGKGLWTGPLVCRQSNSDTQHSLNSAIDCPSLGYRQRFPRSSVVKELLIVLGLSTTEGFWAYHFWFEFEVVGFLFLRDSMPI